MSGCSMFNRRQHLRIFYYANDLVDVAFIKFFEPDSCLYYSSSDSPAPNAPIDEEELDSDEYSRGEFRVALENLISDDLLEQAELSDVPGSFSKGLLLDH